MGKMFGTDGIRGIANKELTPGFFQDRAYYSLSPGGKEHSTPFILLGRDTRISGVCRRCFSRHNPGC